MTDIVDLFNACLYIQDNLDADLSLLFLAQTVGLSRFRFHRVFKAWRGETLHDFVTRMRMERAAFELRYPIPRSSRRSIKAIAFASGYKSLSSFSHAFSSYARLSPRAFRNQALRQKPGVHAEASASSTAVSFGDYAIRVGHQPAREIAVLDPATLSRDGLSLATLARLAATSPVDGDRYGVELLPNIVARAAAGVGGATVRAARLSCLGVALPTEPTSRSQGVRARSTLRLSSGRYAVLEGRGSLASLYRAWRRGFDAWLAESGECPRPDRLYVRFPRPGEDSAHASIALFIPLEDVATPVARAARRSPGGHASPVTASISH
jgi:AraC-like DNA-binding protein